MFQVYFADNRDSTQPSVTKAKPLQGSPALALQASNTPEEATSEEQATLEAWQDSVPPPRVVISLQPHRERTPCLEA